MTFKPSKSRTTSRCPQIIKTLFIGSSSFTNWKILEKDLPEYEPLNRAFGGSTLLHVIRYREEVINKYNPESIVIYCGENDIAASETVTGKMVFERFKVLYHHIREKFPKIKIYYVSIKPCPLRWNMRDRMMEANTQIRRFCKKQKTYLFLSVFGIKCLKMQNRLHPFLWRIICMRILKAMRYGFTRLER